MSGIRPLTRLLKPTEGVSFVAYLEQLAAMHRVSLLVMLKYLGIVRSERYEKLNGYGIILSQERLDAFSQATRLSRERCSQMLLSRYNGIAIDLTGAEAGDAEALRKIATSEWAYFSGSHVCPHCIKESGGAWQIAWKLPWSFACVKHRRFLVESCPACGRRTGSGRTDHSLSPLFVKLVPTLGHCGNPKRFGDAKLGKSSVPCGHPLSDIPTTTAGHTVLKAQKFLNTVLDGNSQLLLGKAVTAFEYLSDLRSICALLLYCAEPEDLGKQSLQEATAFKKFAIERNKKLTDRAESIAPRNEGRTRVFLGATTNPELMAAVAGVAMEILGAASTDAMSDLLRPFAERCGSRSAKSRWEIAKYFRFSERIDAAFHASLAITSAFDRAVGNRSVTGKQTKYTFEPRHVPQLLWLADFEKNFSVFFPEMKANFARRFCAMSLVKLSGEYTWRQTAEFLGLPADSGIKMANKAVGLLAQKDTKKAFGRELHKLALRLSVVTEKVDYADRRSKLSGFIDIPLAEWARRCEASGTNIGLIGGRRKYAAAWLWADITGGDWVLAPGLQEGNIVNLREVFRQLDKSLFPKMADQLRTYGMTLLNGL